MNGLRKMCKLLISEPDRVLARNRTSDDADRDEYQRMNCANER